MTTSVGPPRSSRDIPRVEPTRSTPWIDRPHRCVRMDRPSLIGRDAGGGSSRRCCRFRRHRGPGLRGRAVVGQRRRRRLCRAGRRRDRVGSALRPDQRLPPAAASAGHGANSMGGRDLGAGRADQTAPARRLRVVSPDAGAHRRHHRRLRPVVRQRPDSADLAAGDRLPGHAAGDGRRRCPCRRGRAVHPRGAASDALRDMAFHSPLRVSRGGVGAATPVVDRGRLHRIDPRRSVLVEPVGSGCRIDRVVASRVSDRPVDPARTQSRAGRPREPPRGIRGDQRTGSRPAPAACRAILPMAVSRSAGMDASASLHGVRRPYQQPGAHHRAGGPATAVPDSRTCAPAAASSSKVRTACCRPTVAPSEMC